MKKTVRHKIPEQPSVVRFECYSPGARQVCLAGSFNQWDPKSAQMVPSGRGTWTRELPLSPGTYEYCFVVDGTYVKDPHAKNSVANPFGGFNSIVTVGNSSKSSTPPSNALPTKFEPQPNTKTL